MNSQLIFMYINSFYSDHNPTRYLILLPPFNNKDEKAETPRRLSDFPEVTQ